MELGGDFVHVKASGAAAAAAAAARLSCLFSHLSKGFVIKCGCGGETVWV